MVQYYKFIPYCHIEKGLQCFYCDGGEGSEECSADHPGDIITCQTQNPDGDHFGHTCAVGRTRMIIFFLLKILQDINMLSYLYHSSSLISL